ncbi:MAG: DUF3307 domain-containing protein [Muribaculaceae bacterium]|nr:DUF3307 domain-containing protein [Muribaculaceae bacterium]
MANATLLLIVLLVCHYLADFCLTSSAMIRAKADGRNLLPILLHASIHGALMGICMLFWYVSWKCILAMIALEIVSHFLIDLAKARVTVHFPRLADMRSRPYWMLFGFDQLLHLVVVAFIWHYAIN